MSEKKEQATSSATEQAGKPEDRSACGPQMQQMMTTMMTMMKACGCCAEMVGSGKSESGTRPSTC